MRSLLCALLAMVVARIVAFKPFGCTSASALVRMSTKGGGAPQKRAGEGSSKKFPGLEESGRRQSSKQRSSKVVAVKTAGAYKSDKFSDSLRPNDPWRALIDKLDKTKDKGERFGKVDFESAKAAQNPVIDLLQCKHFKTCGGCSLQGNFTDAPIMGRAKRFFQSEGVAMRLHTNNIAAIPGGNKTNVHSENNEYYWGWRTHVKLAVQPLSKWGGLKMGLFKTGSHDVEPIPDCRVHHPKINEAVEELRQHASALEIKGYTHDTDGKQAPTGELRYVQMTLERESGKVQLVLVWNAFMYKDAEQTLPRLVKRLKQRPDLWHSISVNFQTSAGNVIFNYHPKSWKLLWGPPTIREKIGDAYFYFRPQIFRQANLDAFQYGIIPLVSRNVPQGSKVSELYSGIGVLGLNVAGRAQEVLCSDSNEFVDEVFDKCADSLAEEHREKVFYEQLSAVDAIDQGQCEDAEVLIVDPPRKGLEDEVIDLLLDRHESASSEQLQRLIYISCGFEALENNARALLESGKWRIRSADGFVLFPGSDHIETVCVFDKVAKAGDRLRSEIQVE